MADAREEYTIILKARDEATRVMRELGREGLDAAKKTAREFRRAGTTIANFTRAGIRAMGRLARSVRQLAGSVTGLLTPGFGKLIALFAGVAGIASVTRAAGEFSTAMSEVSTIVDTSTVSMERLRDGVLDLAKAQGSDELIQANALYQAISSGADAASESLLFLEDSGRLAIAGVAEVNETVDLLSSTLNAFGEEFDQATRFSDVFFKTVQLGKTTIPELSANIATAAPIAAALGVSIEEVNAAVAALTAGGTPTAEAFTQVRAVLAGLLKNVDDIDKLFRDRLGETFDINTTRVEGLTEQLFDLRDAVQGNDAELISLLGRVEGVSAILALTGTQAGKFRETLDALENSAGATAEAFDKRLATPAFRVRTAFNALRIETLAIGDAFIEAIDAAITEVGGVDVLARNLRIATDAIGAGLEVTVKRIAAFVASFDEFIVSIGGAENVSKTIVQAVEAIALAFDVLVAGVKDSVTALISTIQGIPTALASIRDSFSLDSILGIARSREEIEAEIDAIERRIAALPQQGFRAELPFDFGDLNSDQAKLAALQRELAELPPTLEEVSSALAEEAGAFDGTVRASSELRKSIADLRASFADLGTISASEQAREIERAILSAGASVQGLASRFLDLPGAAEGGIRSLGDRLRSLVSDLDATGDRLELPVSPVVDRGAFAGLVQELRDFARSNAPTISLLIDDESFAERERIAAVALQVRESQLGLEAQIASSLEDQISIEREIAAVAGLRLSEQLEGLGATEAQVRETLRLLDQVRDQNVGQIGEGFVSDEARRAFDGLTGSFESQEAAVRSWRDETIRALNALQEFEQLTGQQAATLRDYTNALSESELAAIQQERANRRAELGFLTLKQVIEDTKVALADGLGGAFADAIVDGKDFGQAFTQLANQIIKDLIRIGVRQAILSFLFPGSGSVDPSFIGPPATGIAAAKGAVIEGGLSNLKAAGAAFSGAKGLPFVAAARGTTVDRPTFALIGEGSTKEAVIPMPDNRSVPVKFVGDGGGSTFAPTYNITAMDARGVREVLEEHSKTIWGIQRRGMVENQALRRSVQASGRGSF